MTTEDDFQRALDANPGDWQTRLVFADWLQERGDPRAEGYRALGANRLFPRRSLRTAWYWYARVPRTPVVYRESARDAHCLPGDWWDTMLTGQAGFGSRREAEDAAALAFAELPAERRGELLAACGMESGTE